MKAKKLTNNFLIQAGGKALSVLIGLVVIAILTRTLGQHGYGEYTTAITYLQLFGVVVDFGLTLTFVVMLSKEGTDEAHVAGNLLGLRLVSGAVLFSLAPLVVLAFPWSATVKLGVAVGAVAYFLMAGAAMLVGVFQKHAVMWRAAVGELAGRVVLLGLVALFAWWQFGVVAMIAALIAANLLWFLMMVRLARPFVRVRPKVDWGMWKRALTLSWPIALSVFFNLLYLKGDILFLAWFREQNEVGLYGVSYKVIDVLTALVTMFMGLLMPVLVRRWSKNETTDFRRDVTATFDVFMALAIPVVVGTQVVAEPLIRFIAGSDFAVSGSVLKLLIFAIVGVFLGTLFGHTVVALNKQREMIAGYAAVAVVAIAGYLLFIPTHGMWGAAWVTIVSEGLIAGLTFWMVKRVSGAVPSLTITLKALFSAGVMWGTIAFTPLPHVLLTILLGVIVYGAVMFAVGGIPMSLIKQLLPVVNTGK